MNNCNKCQTVVEESLQTKSKKCKKHVYCIRCRSILKIKPSIIENCIKCGNHYKKPHIIGQNSLKKKCTYCNYSKRNYFSVCPSHRICVSCIYLLFPSYEANPDIKCRICLEVLIRSCKRCSIILSDSEKYYKTCCKIHFYCEECVEKSPIESICSACDKPNIKSLIPNIDWLSSQNSYNISNFEQPAPVGNYRSQSLQDSSSISNQNSKTLQISQSVYPDEDRISDITSLSNSVEPYRIGQVFHKTSNSEYQISQILSFLMNNCESCSNQVERKLECGHSFCINCIYASFESDLYQFLSLIEKNMFSEIKTKEFCIKCPEMKFNCSNKFVVPFDIRYYENFFISNNLRYDLRVLVGNCSSFFDGVKYEFYECSSCRMPVGCPEGKQSFHQCNYYWGR